MINTFKLTFKLNRALKKAPEYLYKVTREVLEDGKDMPVRKSL